MAMGVLLVQQVCCASVTGAKQMHFFNNNVVRPSSRVGLHPQLVEYDMSKHDGVQVGVNRGNTKAAPGGTKRYRWYAGDLATELVKEPRNRVIFDIVARPVEFGATNLRWADGTAISNIHQGELGREGAEDSGHAGFNYGSEPSWFRFKLPPDTPFGNAGTPNSFGSIPSAHAMYANGLTENEPNTIPDIAGISTLGDMVTPIFRVNADTYDTNPVNDTRMYCLARLRIVMARSSCTAMCGSVSPTCVPVAMSMAR